MKKPEFEAILESKEDTYYVNHLKFKDSFEDIQIFEATPNCMKPSQVKIITNFQREVIILINNFIN